MGESIAMVLDAGPVGSQASSTVVGFAPDETPLFFRIGPLSEEQIRAALRD
jgi:tRNA A37 threonylcarbamoyladenosine synthetase subunit TsaC/SUA5/YrdC